MDQAITAGTLPSRQGTKVFLASSVVAQVCALLRYVLLARLLGPEQLGWAATLILTAQFFDSITNTGGDRFLIQSEEGDRPDVQRLVHASAILRGCVTAAALILFAVPIAAFFDQPGLAVPLMVLAMAPFLLGFTHMDLRRQQRHNDFRAEGWATLGAELAGLAATAAAAWMLRDYTAALYGLIVRAFMLVVISHLCAERRFAVGLSREFVKPLAQFGIPLMANGLLMFIGSQSDRVLVGDALGPAALGQYSAVLLLILYPSAMVQRYVVNMYLPLIAARSRSGATGEPANGAATPGDSLAVETILLSLAMVVGFAAIAPFATTFLYGRAFRQDAVLVALIGLLQVYRFIRLWPTTEGLANGRSSVPLTGNLVRVIGLLLALVAIHLGYGLEMLIACFIAGELLALIVINLLVNRALRRPASRNADRIGFYVAISTAAVAATWLAAARDWTALGAVGALMVALLLWFVRREAGALAGAMDVVRRFTRRLRRPGTID